MQKFRPHSDKFQNGKQCRRLIRLPLHICVCVCKLQIRVAERAHYLFFACTQSRTLKSQLRRSAGAEAATKRRRPTCLPTETHTRSIVANTHTHTHRTERQSRNYVERRFKMQLMESDVIRVTRSWQAQNKGPARHKGL